MDQLMNNIYESQRASKSQTVATISSVIGTLIALGAFYLDATRSEHTSSWWIEYAVGAFFGLILVVIIVTWRKRVARFVAGIIAVRRFRGELRRLTQSFSELTYSGGFENICAVVPRLRDVQKWTQKDLGNYRFQQTIHSCASNLPRRAKNCKWSGSVFLLFVQDFYALVSGYVGYYFEEVFGEIQNKGIEHITDDELAELAKSRENFIHFLRPFGAFLEECSHTSVFSGLPKYSSTPNPLVPKREPKQNN